MKSIALALVALLAGVCAVPPEVQVLEPNKERFVDDLLVSFIKALIETIIEKGFDPLIIARADGEYTFPVDGILKASAYVEDFLFTGLSNIVINKVSYDDGEIYIDLSFPGFEVVVGNAAAEVQILKRKIEAALSGRLAINDLRLAARANLALSSYLIDDITLSSSLGGIESELNINILGYDISDRVNKFLSETLPEALEKYREQLNRLVANLILRLIDIIF